MSLVLNNWALNLNLKCILKGSLLLNINYHYENTPIQIYRNFHLQKLKIFGKKKTLIFFQISAQNINCGYSLEPPRRGGSDEHPQPMFLSRNKKNNVYPCKHQFYYMYINGGFKGGQNNIGMFS